MGTKFNQTPDGSESWTTNRDNLQRLQREIDSQKAMKFVERAGRGGEATKGASKPP